MRSQPGVRARPSYPGSCHPARGGEWTPPSTPLHSFSTSLSHLPPAADAKPAPPQRRRAVELADGAGQVADAAVARQPPRASADRRARRICSFFRCGSGAREKKGREKREERSQKGRRHCTVLLSTAPRPAATRLPPAPSLSTHTPPPPQGCRRHPCHVRVWECGPRAPRVCFPPLSLPFLCRLARTAARRPATPFFYWSKKAPCCLASLLPPALPPHETGWYGFPAPARGGGREVVWAVWRRAHVVSGFFFALANWEK